MSSSWVVGRSGRPRVFATEVPRDSLAVLVRAVRGELGGVDVAQPEAVVQPVVEVDAVGRQAGAAEVAEDRLGRREVGGDDD